MQHREVKSLLQKQAQPPGPHHSPSPSHPRAVHLALAPHPLPKPPFCRDNPFLCHLSQGLRILGFGIQAWDCPRKQNCARRKGPRSGSGNHITRNLQDCNTSPEPLPTH